MELQMEDLSGNQEAIVQITSENFYCLAMALLTAHMSVSNFVSKCCPIFSIEFSDGTTNGFSKGLA